MGDLQKNPVDTQFIQPNNMENTTQHQFQYPFTAS